MISVDNDVAVRVLGDGDEILDVAGRWHQAIREEESLKVGTLGRAEVSDRWEAADNNFGDQRTV